ncbi:hypothetical protein EYS14_11575 [Alteromonadaceae bacterium M269]|nr:hypothetical protein EYS14_11575 [Alteromonadaceae bacterium M269]
MLKKLNLLSIFSIAVAVIIYLISKDVSTKHDIETSDNVSQNTTSEANNTTDENKQANHDTNEASPPTLMLQQTTPTSEGDIKNPEKTEGPKIQDIGNRPNQLDQIIKTTPSFDGTYVDSYHLSSGSVPKLFRTAGLREGDILKAINDIDISDPAGFDRARAELHRTDTLKFSVLRNGRPLTLYLDIPSDDLKIGR